MMDILFVSETELNPELRLAQSEIAHHGYNISQTVQFSKAINLLKASSINTVLINAFNRKLQAYELCKEIKEVFRGAIKVLVYLPDSNPNEGSKFGLLNAEVEDENTIKAVVEKLTPKQNREYILEENISSIYSLNGGSGSSFIAILLAYVLNHYGKESFVLESSNTFSIRSVLGMDSSLALLSRDRSREINQARDLDWFSGFISKPLAIPKMSYLNLFSTVEERNSFLEQAILFADELSKKIENLVAINDAGGFHNTTEFKSRILSVANSVKLLAKELEGDSFSLFDEIIQLGSKVSKNIFFDLSSDIFSPLNKQLLRFSKNLIIVFRDNHDMKEEYLSQKKLLTDKYNLDVIPVLAPSYYHYTKYQDLSNDEWMQVLGDVPLIYPYAPETVARFTYESEAINESDELFKFALQLLQRLDIRLEGKNIKSERNILRLLKLKGSHA